MVKSHWVCVCGGGEGIYVYTLGNYGNKQKGLNWGNIHTMEKRGGTHHK